MSTVATEPAVELVSDESSLLPQAVTVNAAATSNAIATIARSIQRMLSSISPLDERLDPRDLCDS
ncbi:MAG TPA: hypothetical protein VLK58_26710 [Conexibacter sp.]|nr:hypothetical protein [Conexibacter sp.]